MRPIDGDALKESLQQSYCKLVEIYQKYQDGKTKAQLIAFKEAILRTNDQPTLDVEPVRHGRWMQVEGFTACSECGASPADWEAKPNNPLGVPPFCHSCGAKMDAKEEEE